MLSPSDNLTNSVIELQICTAQQLLSCEPEVRQLAGDLPGFDSCWLDVLIAHRLLTPWQAGLMQSDNPHFMRQGAYRLREPIGQRTWQAETLDRSRLVVLSRLADDDRPAAEHVLARARSEVEAANDARPLIPESVCLPREYFRDERTDCGWVVSPFVPGWQLDELLIRGGRLPWQVVVEIGRALLNGLQKMQLQGLNHGDISLRNVRLQPDGQPILVDPFTARWLKPSIGFRADLRLRDIRHYAPDLIGSGRQADAVSDLYSLGTVLWQLLTGRPTFISADPVVFLMQCREHDVEDVRHWVPDCPDELAYQLQLFTRRRPELRPQTIAAALDQWKVLPDTGVSATRRLLRRMPDRSRMLLAPKPTLNRRQVLKRGWAIAALTSCVMVGLSSSLIPLPLNLRRIPIADGPDRVLSRSTADDQHVQNLTSEPMVLPEPTAGGVIELTGGQRYTARTLQQPGTIHIHSSGDRLAIVVVPQQASWKISADQLQLTGLQIRFEHDPIDDVQPLLDVHCQVLELDRTIVGSDIKDQSTGLRWTPLSDSSSIVRLMNTVFISGRYAIRTAGVPGNFAVRNVLFHTAETAWRCDSSGHQRVPLNMTKVTQLGGNSFADIKCDGDTTPLQIDITCGESVLTPAQSLVRLASTAAQWSPQDVTVTFRMPSRANPTIVLPTTNSVVWFDRSLKQTVALSDSQVLRESLLMAQPKFDSSPSRALSFSTAKLIDYDGPKRGQQLPGVDVTLLPELPSGSETTEGDEK
ncbi:MAG: protein kinase [Fuerstiella sp.]|nr:protein kinase [Fuerstiella sp.]